MRSSTRTMFALLVTVTAAGSNAEEARLSLRSTVSGSQEQPRVMYIVPWQQPNAAQFDYELRNTIAAELFSQVDRYEFTRAIAYREQLIERSPDTHPGAAPQDNTLNKDDQR